MKVINTLSDAEVALKQLEARINALTNLPTLDFHKRRIVNAGPSADQYDYVVRKELVALNNEVNVVKQTIAASSVIDYDLAVFGIAIETNIETGQDVCPHHIAVFNGYFTKIYLKAKTAPVGSPITFDIKLNQLVNGILVTSTILNSTLAIPDGSNRVVMYTDFSERYINEGDFLTIDVTGIGSTIPGSTIVVKVKYKKL